jgi:ketosteroid isomerase-like protein
VWEENVQVLRRAYEAMARRDSEALEALARDHLAPAFEFESVLTGRSYEGVEGLRELPVPQ